jgi:hypothetical protein
MKKNYKTMGHEEGTRDYLAGKKAQPHKLRHLFGLSLSKENTDLYLQGYSKGYEHAELQALRQQTRDIMRENIPSRPKSPNRLDRLNEARNRFPNTPEKEPEY